MDASPIFPPGYAIDTLTINIYTTVCIANTLSLVYSLMKNKSNQFSNCNISMFAAVFVIKTLCLLLIVLYIDCMVLGIMIYNGHVDAIIIEPVYLVACLYDVVLGDALCQHHSSEEYYKLVLGSRYRSTHFVATTRILGAVLGLLNTLLTMILSSKYSYYEANSNQLIVKSMINSNNDVNNHTDIEKKLMDIDAHDRICDEKLICSNNMEADLDSSFNDLLLSNTSESVKLATINHVEKGRKCRYCCECCGSCTIKHGFTKLLSRISHKKEEFDQKLFDRFGIDTQTSVLVVNSLMTGITVSIAIAADNDGCIIEHEDSDKISDTCLSRLITIGVSLFVLVLVFVRYVMNTKCDRRNSMEINSNVHVTQPHFCRYLFMWSFNDFDYRAIILTKFIFWMIKPYLISSNHDNKQKILGLILDLVFEILMFLSTTTLAYLSFNKNYQYLEKLNFLKNCKYFIYCYIFNYIITIIAMYSILIFVVMFEFQAYFDERHIGKYFNKWYVVIYPQCAWILFIKLYFNEISQIIGMIKDYNKHFNQKKLLEFVLNGNISQKVEYAATRLFIFQVFVIIGSFISFYMYFLEIVRKEQVYANNAQWDVIWYWQLLLSMAILCSMPLAAFFGLNTKCQFFHCCTMDNDTKRSLLID